MLNIRFALEKDYSAIWEIFQNVVKTGDTYVFDPNISKEEALNNWVSEKTHSYVAEINGQVCGTFILKAIQPGLGSHIANASYMVLPTAHGKGIGKAMAAHSISEAKRLHFKAMQFNVVVSTNEVAVRLWKKMGFSIIGTVPEAFQHATKGLVDTYIMYRKL